MSAMEFLWMPGGKLPQSSYEEMMAPSVDHGMP